MADLAGRLNSLANRVWAVAPGSRTSLTGRDVRLVAHRGAHGPGEAVENTLEAFELCLANRVWGIELDVHLTRDLEPVIHHDPHCGRLFGQPELIIPETDFGNLRAAVPAIPHLAEVVERFGGRLHLMLEIKESWRERPEVPEVITRTLAGLTPEVDFHLLSLVPDHLEGFRDIPTAAYVDVAWFNAGEIVTRNLQLGHGAVSGSFALLTKQRIRRLRSAGSKVGTGFIETPGALRREVARGVDWIFTDCALDLQSVINAEH